MADLSMFERNRPNLAKPLRVDVILSELDESRAESLRTALTDPATWNAQVIVNTLRKEWDITCSVTAVRNWRDRNGC